MTSENVPPTAELKEIENGSAETWNRLTPAQQAEMATWSKPAPAAPSAAPPPATSTPAATPAPQTTRSATSLLDPTSASEQSAEQFGQLLTEQQQAEVEKWMQPPTSPSEYKFSPPWGSEQMPVEMMTRLQTGAHAIGLNTAEFKAFELEAYRVAELPNDPANAELQAVATAAVLERKYGEDGAAQLVKDALRVLAPVHAKDPALAEAARRILRSSPAMIISLAQVAQRRAAN